MQTLIRANGFGPFYHDGQEMLRRIFVTVRDGNWCEVSPTEWQCRPNEAERIIDVSARHRSELVDFEWQGRLQLSGDGRELNFEVRGEAKKTMDVCRLGLIILHPVDWMAGATLTTRGPEGEQRLQVPASISAQPILDGMPQAMTKPFSSMTISHPRRGRLELKLAGELFELEDQRNWGDASFKTYCTPLKLGFPRRVRAGTEVMHRLEARLDPLPMGCTSRGAPAERGLNLSRVTKIGRVAPAPFESMHSYDWMIGWDHIRVDWDGLDDHRLDGLVARLPRGVSLKIGAAAEEASGLDPQLVTWLNRHATQISALIVSDPTRPLPTAAGIKRMRDILRGTAASQIPLLASPTGYFVELNRQQPFELEVDGVAFPLSSTVHGGDVETILDNAHAVGDVVEAARRLTAKKCVAISPLALYVPPRADSSCFPKRLIMPWLATLIAQASSAGAESITLAADVIDRLAGT